MTRIGRWLRGYLRCLLLIALIGFIAAVITGLVIRNSLLGFLEQVAVGPPPVTALPVALALDQVRSFQATFVLKDSRQTTLAVGHGLFVRPINRNPDWLLSFEQPQLNSGHELLFVNEKHYIRDRPLLRWQSVYSVPGSDTLPRLYPFESSSSLMRLFGIDPQQVISAWKYTGSAILEGRQVSSFQTDDLNAPLLDAILGQAGWKIQASSADVTLGRRDHLPYEISYRFDFDKSESSAIVLDIRLFAYNEPVSLSLPEGGL